MTAAQPFPSVRYDYAEKVKLLYFAPHPWALFLNEAKGGSQQVK